MSESMESEDSSMHDVSNGMAHVGLDDKPSTSADDMNTNEYEEGLPSVLIVTNVDEAVFNTPESKNSFEEVFKRFDPKAEFQYLKSFRRVRVVFESPLFAAKTRVHLHETEVNGKTVKCYFSQPLKQEEESSQYLQPPPPTKQFLISPPASPPVGWEPHEEAEPIINYDILSALAGLAPGEAHELHPQTSNQPGIVVHICENPQGFESRPLKIAQTKRPDAS